MDIQSLKPAKGSRKKSTRVGRGYSSGKGKTSGRGQKGQNSRSGGGVRPGFEGGQLPLIRKLAIRGFNNKNFAKVYSIVNISTLDQLEPNTVVNEKLLYEYKIIGKMEPNGLKVLGNGEITKPLTVQATKFTKSAIEKIEKAGGKIEVI
ncbi:MAG: 50S ribosomal protein L15 [Clostridia bacterium]|nr:50S ribosomal protein L15 [Clostridia bacterium]MDD4686019.1 50S ribosomal protein L15 [Clostridia bacterium]